MVQEGILELLVLSLSIFVTALILWGVTYLLLKLQFADEHAYEEWQNVFKLVLFVVFGFMVLLLVTNGIANFFDMEVFHNAT
jgi:hypothetical protein